jgi:hypothetical protein
MLDAAAVGPGVRVLDAGCGRLKAAVLRAIAPYDSGTGSVRLELRFRYVVAGSWHGHHIAKGGLAHPVPALPRRRRSLLRVILRVIL